MRCVYFEVINWKYFFSGYYEIPDECVEPISFEKLLNCEWKYFRSGRDKVILKWRKYLRVIEIEAIDDMTEEVAK
ncbi:hypothetical protein SD71_10870 [Cohnella kolymensis]|uniref:Uncharacterized protein n=1 Tax=Cohnella kolymensis TaxID=1590652 RepID=A0ABR5A5F4_9BACL|nr:hypothetical protein SD71_10870 [Cohnella kolymensis]